jgi:hypothetical protein
VGKGSNGRIKDHRNEAKRITYNDRTKSIKINIIHKLFRMGLDYEVDIVLSNLTEEEAFGKEKAFIQSYGRINNKTGVLSNLTDGGDGPAGMIVSRETLAKLSESHKGQCRKHSEETKRKISVGHKGKKLSKEQIELIRKNSTGRFCSEETRAKLRAKRFNHTDEAKRKISAAHKGRKLTEAQRAHISEIQRGRKASEETKQKMRESQQLRRSIEANGLEGFIT